jgi:hypothetical protein
MLPNSGSATATINGNPAYGWYHYDVGDILVTTYNMPTFDNPCLDCHDGDSVDCSFVQNDVVTHAYPIE